MDVLGRGAKGSSGSFEVVMRSISISNEPSPPKSPESSLRSVPPIPLTSGLIAVATSAESLAPSGSDKMAEV